MSQITSGVRSILSHPLAYSAFQFLMGAHRSRKKFVAEFIRPFNGMHVLDVGCGPADILAYLPKVAYYGFDINEQYIAQAQRRFKERGSFQCKYIEKEDLEKLPLCDIVLAIGLLHHVDNSTATNILQLASRSLKPGGRLITIDPCLDPTQSLVARILIQNDRGQNVRNKLGYETLAKTAFESPRVEVRHTKWIPYTHCIMECRK